MENTQLSSPPLYTPISIAVGFADDLAAATLVAKVYAKKTDFESIRTGKANDEEPNQTVELDIGDKTLIKKDAGDSDKKNHRISSEKTKDEKLEEEMMDNIYLDQFNANDFTFLCQQILHGDLESYKKLNKNKQIEFLVKLYRTPEAMSDEIIEALLPYVNTDTLNFTFRFGDINALNDKKRMAFLKRLAPEESEIADDLTIKLLIMADEIMLTNCPLDTLLALRKKEYLGQHYFERILQSNNGKGLSKEQFQQLSKLSAKITTVCFAYFLESAGTLYERSAKEQLSFTRKDLNQIKGLTKAEKDTIYTGFQQKGLVDTAQQPTALSANEEAKKKINDILASALAMAADFMDSTKTP